MASAVAASNFATGTLRQRSIVKSNRRRSSHYRKHITRHKVADIGLTWFH